MLGVHEAIARIDIGEDHIPARVAHRICGRRECHRRHNRNIARVDVEGQYREVQGGRAARADRRETGFHQTLQRCFECLYGRPGRQVIALKNIDNSIDVVKIDPLTSVRYEIHSLTRS